MRTHVSLLLGILAAVLTFTLLMVGAHLWQDHADHHLVLEVLRYNIQQGKLLQLPGPPPPPTPEKK